MARVFTDGELRYAATARCPCGAGLAYPPDAVPEDGPFRYWSYWDCSAILKGTADPAVQHTAQLPFAFYEIKCEAQPSARGATTRPPRGDQPRLG